MLRVVPMAHLGSKRGVVVVDSAHGATGDPFGVDSRLVGLLGAGFPVRIIDVLEVVTVPINGLQGTTILAVLDTKELAETIIDLDKGTDGSLGLDKRTLVVGRGGLAWPGIDELAEGLVGFDELAVVIVCLAGEELADVAVEDSLERTLWQ